MTWFVEEYFDKTLRSLDLCPNVDVDLKFGGDAPNYSEDIDIMIWWHKPSTNLDWYPIGHIDFGLKTIFHREGAENPDRWEDLLNEMADFIKTYHFGKENRK